MLQRRSNKTPSSEINQGIVGVLLTYTHLHSALARRQVCATGATSSATNHGIGLGRESDQRHEKHPGVLDVQPDSGMRSIRASRGCVDKKADKAEQGRQHMHNLTPPSGRTNERDSKWWVSDLRNMLNIEEGGHMLAHAGRSCRRLPGASASLPDRMCICMQQQSDVN